MQKVQYNPKIAGEITPVHLETSADIVLTRSGNAQEDLDALDKRIDDLGNSFFNITALDAPRRVPFKMPYSALSSDGKIFAAYGKTVRDAEKNTLVNAKGTIISSDVDGAQKSIVAIPELRGCKGIYDEISSGTLIRRTGIVRLKDLTWDASGNTKNGAKRFRSTGLSTLVNPAINNDTAANAICSHYDVLSDNQVINNNVGIEINNSGVLYVYDEQFREETTPVAFVSWIMTADPILIYELKNIASEPYEHPELKMFAGGKIDTTSDAGYIAPIADVRVSVSLGMRPVNRVYVMKDTASVTIDADTEGCAFSLEAWTVVVRHDGKAKDFSGFDVRERIEILPTDVPGTFSAVPEGTIIEVFGR